MEVTNELLQRFVGGEVMIRNLDLAICIIGPTKAVYLTDGGTSLCIAFLWTAKCYPNGNSRFVERNGVQTLSMNGAISLKEEERCLEIHSFDAHRVVAVLYPKGTGILDPNKVEDLPKDLLYEFRQRQRMCSRS